MVRDIHRTKIIDIEALDSFASDPIISNNQWLKIKNVNQAKKVNLSFKFQTLAREEYEINFYNVEVENNGLEIHIYG
jgi:hypothetical protein